MKLVRTIYDWRRLWRNQWLSRDRLEALQLRKLRCLLTHAYEFVPYYRSLFSSAGWVPEDFRSLEDLANLPTTRKADLQNLEPEHVRSCRFSDSELTAERTSGSTGQPFTVYHDAHFKTIRNLLFLRALRSAGCRLGQKVFLITDMKNKKRRAGLPGWHYTSLLNSPSRLCDEFNRVRPTLLYGPRTPLRLMAEHRLASNDCRYYPRTVVSTAETMDGSTRKLIETAFAAEVFDFYGLTEMGIVGWECGEHQGYHLAEDTTLIEYMPDPDLNGGGRLVMTNLHQLAMPLIRFETGDIASPPDSSPCRCGRTFVKTARIQGRLADAIRLKDGVKLAPYQLTCPMEEVLGLNQYQIIQEALDRFKIKLKVGGGVDRREMSHTIQTLMRSLAGSDIHVAVEYIKADLFDPVKKFRVVSSRI